MELLIGNDAVVVHQHVEHGSSQVPGRGVEMPQLIFQFDSAGVIHTPCTGRSLRRHRHGAVEITRRSSQQPTLEAGISPGDEEGVDSSRVTQQLRHGRRGADQVG